MKLIVFVADNSLHSRGMNLFEKYGWGRIWARENIQKIHPREPCAFDNGAFNAWRKGKPFPRDKFSRRIDSAVNRGIDPTFAILPDVVMAGRRSLDFSAWWLHCGDLPTWWNWYLAVQNGIEIEFFKDYDLSRIKGIFLGGDDGFKTTAHYWKAWTDENDLRFHYGRCSTVRRVEAAISIGADSIDSMLFSPFRWSIPSTRRMVELVTGTAQPHPRLYE